MSNLEIKSILTTKITWRFEKKEAWDLHCKRNINNLSFIAFKLLSSWILSGPISYSTILFNDTPSTNCIASHAHKPNPNINIFIILMKIKIFVKTMCNGDFSGPHVLLKWPPAVTNNKQIPQQTFRMLISTFTLSLSLYTLPPSSLDNREKHRQQLFSTNTK